MSKQSRHFNIDNTVSFFADVECNKVYGLWLVVNGVTKDFSETLGLGRAINVKAAVEFLLADSSARSVTTDCGVTVHRGM